MTRARILVLVENLPVPFDRRVWQESRALVEAGHEVVVICPAGATTDTEPETLVDGVRILRYPLRPATGGPLGYPREYGLAMWHTLRLALRVRREGRVDVVHACNPPDLLFLVAVALRPFGARFVFDHHDLVPELFESRFGTAGGPLHRVARLLERLTFLSADAVISTNESYRRVAIGRGGVDPDRVTVVRSAPDLTRFVPREPDPALRRGRPHLAAYLGVMGPQDGVDYALRALAHLHDELGRDDLHTIFMGGGDCLEEMIALRDRLGLTDTVEFTGRVPDEFVQVCLSTADVALSPDPCNALNDLSTMNKVVEYMAMGVPVVSFDLTEARVSAGDAAVYAADDDVTRFAELVAELLDDPARRAAMGERGRARVAADLSWDTSRRHLIDFYDRVLGTLQEDTVEPTALDAETHAGAQHFCDLVRDDPAAGAEPRILVAGAGEGHEARYIADRMPGTVVGYDIAPEWDDAVLDGADGLELYEGSILDLPLEDKSVDAVFYHHVIEHVSDPALSLRELSRVLKPGGMIYVGTPNRHRALGYVGSYSATLAEKIRWNAADWRARLAGRFHNSDGAHAGFSQAELHRLLAADFRDVTSLTESYLRFKYGHRVPARAMALLRNRALRDVAAPSVYAVARR